MDTAVMLDAGKIVPLGKIGMTRQHLCAFAHTLTHDDHVVIEATGNAVAVSEVLAPHVGRVVIANPRQVRLIAEARIRTDTMMRPSWHVSTPAASCPRFGFPMSAHWLYAGSPLLTCSGPRACLATVTAVASR
jgi:hypothetical protein